MEPMGNGRYSDIPELRGTGLARLKETTGGEFRVCRASIMLL